MDQPALDIFLAQIDNYSCFLYTSTTLHLYSITFQLINIETFSSRQDSVVLSVWFSRTQDMEWARVLMDCDKIIM